MKNYNQTITNYLKELGIPASLSGYRYLKYAIDLTIKDVSLVNNITKTMYPTVAEHFNTTAVRVERAMRTAIGVGYQRGNLQTIQKLFGYTINMNKSNPTNSEFIATVADYICTFESEV